MDNQLTPYSAYFKLYDPKRNNLQVAFNVTCKPDDDVAEFVNKYQDLIEALTALGMQTEPLGLDEGEKVQEVDGWVLGETANNGQPCVHLYKSPLEWKVATVYMEKIDRLPINIAGTKPWDGAAPTREQAEKKKVLHPCNFKIVMVDSGKTSDKGNKIFRFDRMYGTPKGDAPDTTTGPGPAAPMTIDSYPDIIAKLTGEARKMADWGRKIQEKNAKSVASAETLGDLITIVDEMVDAPGAAEILLSILSGLDPIDLSDGISQKLIDQLLEWVPSHIEDEQGKIVDNPKYVEKYAKALLEMWLTTKQFVEFED